MVVLGGWGRRATAMPMKVVGNDRANLSNDGLMNSSGANGCPLKGTSVVIQAGSPAVAVA